MSRRDDIETRILKRIRDAGHLGTAAAIAAAMADEIAAIQMELDSSEDWDGDERLTYPSAELGEPYLASSKGEVLTAHTATGADLDYLATMLLDDYRRLGETDAELRQRCLEYMRHPGRHGASEIVVLPNRKVDQHAQWMTATCGAGYDHGAVTGLDLDHIPALDDEEWERRANRVTEPVAAVTDAWRGPTDPEFNPRPCYRCDHPGPEHRPGGRANKCEGYTDGR